MQVLDNAKTTQLQQVLHDEHKAVVRGVLNLY